MDLLWIVLPVFLLYAEAQNLSAVQAKLGRNATLTCSVNTSDTYWYIEIRSQVKGFIARTFSTDPSDTQYHVFTTLRTKYTAMGNKLVITNTTAEDCRLYFCARKQNANIIFTDIIRLTSDAPFTSCTNDSETNKQQQHNWRILHSELVVYSSFALNALLILMGTGLVCTSLCLKRKNCNHQVTDPSHLTYENPETLETPQYEEIQLRAPPSAVPTLECIYYKAQLPRSTLPLH